MNEVAFRAISQLLDSKGVKYAVVEHNPCKTSDESRMARSGAGYPDAIGAKALLAKLYFKGGEKFATIVLPGNHVLDKDKLIQSIPELKKMRFATPEEMTQLAGVVPGCMPPFAAPIFPEIPILVVATAIKEIEQLGFNAAYLEKSIIASSKGYLSAVAPNFVLDCSVPK